MYRYHNKWTVNRVFGLIFVMLGIAFAAYNYWLIAIPNFFIGFIVYMQDYTDDIKTPRA